MSELTPREIVNELDRYIIGQHQAKRAVAIALRNRWRRMQLSPALRNEVTPKNILMIGPTGVGKTEIARRLATLANAPFIKVEATKFTEVGYVGKDVEQIIRDLADAAVKMVRDQAKTRVRTQAEDRAEERVLDALLPRRQGVGFAQCVLGERTTSAGLGLCHFLATRQRPVKGRTMHGQQLGRFLHRPAVTVDQLAGVLDLRRGEGRARAELHASGLGRFPAVPGAVDD